jgi:hypothetical protein
MTTTEIIFRDERMPGIEIRNSGGAIFNIWIEGTVDHHHSEFGWSNVDCFTRYPDDDRHNMSPCEAAKVATEHFDDMLEAE